ncbi:MAG: universal stress protein [Bryobacterales bacterium]|nr:universal stress protein [Bryobacteraceae bacterium]MDW8131706.1 universal stress protein [Bryobacterales bacterium]
MPLEHPKHILAPVDFSDLSALALQYADALARCSGARITVLHASSFEAPPYFTQGQIEELRSRLRTAQRQAERELREFARKALGEGAVLPEFRVIEGRPVETILHAARQLGADLIAMGTHGRSGWNRLMLGSVTERVLRETEVPVLTVRAGTAPPSRPLAIRNILCPVNDTAVARRALEHAAEMARCLDATLTLLHVDEGGKPDRIADFCAWVPAEQRTRCRIREVVRRGEASREIVAQATEERCDLLVIGAQHRRFFDSTVIGPTSVRVVRHAPCPVLTVVARDHGEVS